MDQGSARTTPGSALTAEQEAIWFAYMRVTLRMDFEVNRELHAHSGLSHSDFHVLNALADSPDRQLPITDLAVRISWERSRLSHHLLRMERRELVHRQSSPDDGRVTVVHLAGEGRKALHRATASHRVLVKSLFFDGLDPALLGPLRAGLDQIHTQLVAHGTLPGPPGHQERWAD